ncbi:hypothetical protein DAPPUDRAFT_13455, partial [Daphnia pulex]
SEKRKEKSREAARYRRSQEVETFNDLANLLPVSSSLISQLDKASIMRLTIAFLKVQSLLDNKLFGMLNENQCSIADACWPQALGGMLLALSSKGDIVYLTENVTQELGLLQMDLIGQSFYDYCHPCDHDELREMLALRPDGDPARSFCLRFKSALMAKKRSKINPKFVPYKVYGQMLDTTTTNCILIALLSSSTNHFLVLIVDPIPHPSCTKTPLGGYSFLTKHTLDMKYTYVDEKIYTFLGYTPEDLKGRSAYELHHAQDNETVLKNYKAMFAKGQMQVPAYRFLAKQGGYAWVQTQATLVVYGQNRHFRTEAVVCVHTCLR